VRPIITRIVYKKGFILIADNEQILCLENHARFKKAIQSANAFEKLTDVILCSFLKSFIIYNPCSYYYDE